MKESIYTMKLVARGHTVPEGLESAMMSTYRVRDLMEADFSVSGTGGDVLTDRGFVIRSDGGRINRVTVQAGPGAATDGASPARSVAYTMSGEQTMLFAALTEMWAAEAQIILVSRNPDGGRPEDITGVVTPATIARFLQARTEII